MNDIGQAETTLSDHVARFWRTVMEGSEVRILVDIRRPESFGGLGHWDGSSFSDDVAKALRAENDALIAALVRIHSTYGPNHMSRYCRDEAARALDRVRPLTSAQSTGAAE